MKKNHHLHRQIHLCLIRAFCIIQSHLNYFYRKFFARKRKLKLPSSSNNKVIIFSFCLSDVLSFVQILRTLLQSSAPKGCLTTSLLDKLQIVISSILRTTFVAISNPDTIPDGRSFCVESPVITTFEPKPILVRNIFI